MPEVFSRNRKFAAWPAVVELTSVNEFLSVVEKVEVGCTGRVIRFRNVLAFIKKVGKAPPLFKCEPFHMGWPILGV